jgi:hypothetical protein
VPITVAAGHVVVALVGVKFLPACVAEARVGSGSAGCPHQRGQGLAVVYVGPIATGVEFVEDQAV